MTPAPENPPALRELCLAATPGPWRTAEESRGMHRKGFDLVIRSEEGPVSIAHAYPLGSMRTRANAQLIARFSPATALAVYEALTEAENVMQISANIQDANKGIPVTHDLAIGLKRVLPIVRRSIALLDGRTEL